MNKIVMVTLLALTLCACATINPELRMARNAMAAGEAALAEYYLEDVLRQGSLSAGERDEAVHMLVQAYWEQGKDSKLVDFAKERMSARQADLWWCRVLERRGNYREAASCWQGVGEIARMERAIRQAALVSEFAGSKTAVGVRRP